MDISKLRKITNHYHDIRLISLKDWKAAPEFSPRDKAGPYIVAQEGYSPEDLAFRADEFVLSRSGQWLSTHRFYSLPQTQRRSEFIFGTMAEVMRLFGTLGPQVSMWAAEQDAEADGDRIIEMNDLNTTFTQTSNANGPNDGPVPDAN